MKVILAAIGQVILDWVGFQFLDEAKKLVQSPTMAASTQGYIGLIAIIGATVLGCYLVYNAYKWVSTARSASFKAEILNRKSGYHEGDTVQFWAQYAGRLDKGYFLAEVNAPPGTILPNGGQKVQVVDPTTYHSPLVGHGRMGRVSGTNTPPREWGFQIPSKYPAGKSQVVFEVWDGEFGKAKPLGWKEDFFVVESGGRPAEQPTEITNREREDFKNGVAAEIYFLLKMFVDPLHHWNLDCRSWSSKAEQSKAAILGKEDYLVLRSLYDAIEERNRYFARGSGMSLDEVDPLNRKCVEAFSRAYSEVTWLKIASDTDSLLSNARKNVGLL